MYWRWAVLFLTVFLSDKLYGQQCPTFNFFKLNESIAIQKFCRIDSMKFSADVKNTLGIDSIEFYWDSVANFNPYAGQGKKITTTSIKSSISATPCDICPQMQAIFINACNGSGLEADNEFLIFNSGSGFKASDIQLKYNANNTGQDGHINIGTSICGIQTPTNGLMDSIRKNTGCNNLNVLAIGPSDTLPPNATVIFFHSKTVTKRYDLSNFCQSGNNLYVMQSSCKRNAGAYGNSGIPSRIDSVVLSLKFCSKCRDVFKYDRTSMKNIDGEYAVRHSSGVSSVANGSLLLNNANPCEGPLTNFTPAFLDVAPVKFNINDLSKSNSNFGICGYDTLYLKAIFKNHPNSFSCKNTAIGAASNVIKTLIYCPDVFITGDYVFCDQSNKILTAQKKYKKPISPSETYLWDNGIAQKDRSFVLSGVYKVKMSQDICMDSAEITTKNAEPFYSKTNAEIVSCKEVLYLGRTFKKDTLILDTFKTHVGNCDSIEIRQKIRFIAPKYDTASVLIGCNSFEYKNVTYYSDTNVAFLISASNGCDSILRYQPIKIFKTTILKDTIKRECDSVYFGSQYYKKDTIFMITNAFHNFGICDSTQQKVTLTIYSKAFLEILDSPKTTQYIGNSIKLSSNLDAKKYNWNWQNDSTKAITFLMDKELDIWLKTIDSNNCISNATFKISPKEKERFFALPTAFSPNGDFRNDVFKPEFQKTIEIISMTVFNRIGEMVYYGLGDQVGWDGRYKGELQNNGSYLCTVIYRKEGALKKYTSTFDLLR